MKLNTMVVRFCAASFAIMTTLSTYAESDKQKDDAVEEKINKLLSQMTLEEKISMCHGKTLFSNSGVKRLGIPAMIFSDGPHGVRQECKPNSYQPDPSVKDDDCTYLPTGTALAATWNPEMAKLHGRVLGSEARNRGKDVILGPGINIIRIPTCGRNFEYYSEDPFLTSRMVVPEVRSIQEQGVSACVKHYIANSQELNRFNFNAIIDERTLREIYLPGYEAAVKEGGVLTVMGAYNSFRGVNCCQNKHLLDILKKEWGFQGIVVTDWGARITYKLAAENGLDVEMPSASRFGKPLLKAIKEGKIDVSVLDDKVRRILRVLLKIGAFDKNRSQGARNTKEHRHMAKVIAEEAMVLLKNNGLLPINKEKVKKLLVVGPNAKVKHGGIGGSSGVLSAYEITPLQGIENICKSDGIKVEYASFRFETITGISTKVLSSVNPVSGIKAWKIENFVKPNFQSKSFVEYDNVINFRWWRSPLKKIKDKKYRLSGSAKFSVRWSGTLMPNKSGSYTFTLQTDTPATLYIDNKPILTASASADGSATLSKVDFNLEKDKELPIRLDCKKFSRTSKVGLGMEPAGTSAKNLNYIVEKAKKADAVIFVGGLFHRIECEGQDRVNLKLYGKQDEVISAIAKANKNTVVALVCGSPVAMPWRNDVAAIINTWYAGMEAGNALGEILLGKVNPSGKLPVTFPKQLSDSPAFALDAYHADTVVYKEGILVGYRWFDTKKIEPLFPFGHGLSYTTFKYSDLKVQKGAGNSVATVSVTITNTGKRAGKEVVQLYLQDPKCTVKRPEKELKGFRKIDLKPGESKKVTFALTKRDLAFYDVKSKTWVAEKGDYNVLVGSSSRDIRQKGKFTY